MDIQTRKLFFIQDFLKYANPGMLDKFEDLLEQERNKSVGNEIHPMSINDYEQRIFKALEDVKNNRIKHARTLKAEIATWK